MFCIQKVSVGLPVSSAVEGLLVCSLLVAACNPLVRMPAVNPDPNHTHADFAVWVNEEKLDFSAPEYMSEKEEGDDNHEEHGHKHHDYLHLHDGNGDVLHRHKPGLKFVELLYSIGFIFRPDLGTDHHCITVPDGRSFCNESDVSPEQSWQFFINGKPFSEAGGTEVYGGIAHYVFADGDQLLLTFGADTSEVQRELRRMTDDACLYSKTCPERGDPPAENCIADPAVPCVAPLE